MIFPIPGCVPMKPGSATLPFFGIQPVLLNEDGKELNGPNNGFLAFKVCVILIICCQINSKCEKSIYFFLKKAWPSIARTIDGNHERFENTYFKKFPKYYFTGDGMKYKLHLRAIIEYNLRAKKLT